MGILQLISCAQSLSDESFSSPRIKSPVLKASRAAASQLPWWTEEDEGDAKLTEDIRQSWMKPQQTETRNEEGDANKVKVMDRSLEKLWSGGVGGGGWGGGMLGNFLLA